MGNGAINREGFTEASWNLVHGPVIKWILIVLLAAFIGQFGKVLAQTVMAENAGEEGPLRPLPGHPSLPAKKMLPRPVSRPPASKERPLCLPPPVPPDAAGDKKMLKAQAKLAKKSLKKK